MQLGDGNNALAVQKVIQRETEAIEALKIAESALQKRLDYFKGNAEKGPQITHEIEELWNNRGAKLAKRFFETKQKSANVLAEIDALNEQITQKTAEYRRLLGESLYKPQINISGDCRFAIRDLNNPMPVEPWSPHSYGPKKEPKHEHPREVAESKV